MLAAAVGAGIVSLLAVLNLRLGRSALYPPAQFALIWSGLLVLSVAFSGAYYPLSVESVSLFCTGALAFSAGGALRLAVRDSSRSPYRHRPPGIPARFVHRALAVSFVALLFLFPVFWRHILSLADPHFRNIWWGIRSGVIALSEIQGQKSWENFFFDNVTVVSILLALTAAAHYGERGMSRLVAFGLLIVATLFNLTTASRSGAATVLVGALGVRMIKRGRVSRRHLVAGIAGFAIMYVPLTLLRSGSGDPMAIALDDVSVVGDSILLYTVGPLAAFDAYLRNPAALTETWSVSYFFSHAANRMGFDVSAPSTHLGYVMVGPNSATNVYTMYLAYYPEFGWAGVIVLTAAVGYLMVWLYQAASSRRNYWLILYGIGFNEICKSGVNEGFFFGLNMWIKAAAFCAVLAALERVSAARTAAWDLRASPAGGERSLSCR